MRRLLILLILFMLSVSSTWALTMAEAIETAMQHNPQIARALALTQASASRSAKAQSPFWPTLGVNYSYWQADQDPALDSRDLSTVTASARFNLFNGGSDWFRLEAAQSRHKAAQWLQKSVIADVVLSVRQAYIAVLRAEQNLATASKSLELLQSQYEQAGLRLEQGLIARNDLLRIAVEMATAQQGKVAAASSVAVARQSLSAALGIALDDDIALVAVVQPEVSLGAAEDLQEKMLTSRSELKYLRSQLAAQTSDRKAVRGDFLPEVTLTQSYDRFGNETFPERDDTNYDSDSTTMLQASWTLFSGFETRHELAVRKNEILALKEEIRGTQDLLKVQLRSVLEDYRVAQTNLLTARASVAQAEENYRVNESRYKAQVATTVDLLDAQEFLTRARNEANKAQHDLYSAAAAIDRVLETNIPGRRVKNE